jgi:hypothetical protein
MTAPHNPKDYRNTCEEIAAVREWNDARLAANHAASVRLSKLALAALAAIGAVIVWRVLL